MSSTVVDSRVDESDQAFSYIPPDQLFNETMATVADQQSNVVESPVSVSGEVVVSDAVDQSEVVIPTAAELSSGDVVSTVPDPSLLTACTPASSVLQIATDDGATPVEVLVKPDATARSHVPGNVKKDHILNAFADGWVPGVKWNRCPGVVTAQFEL